MTKFATPQREERWKTIMEAIDVQITPYPEVIATGKLIECASCEGSGSVPDESISLPWEITKKCRLCNGKGRYPGLTAYDPTRL